MPEVRVIDPNPAVCVVESESRSSVGAVVPVASVTWAETVTCLAPSLTSTVFGLKSKSDNTGADVSRSIAVAAVAAPTPDVTRTAIATGRTVRNAVRMLPPCERQRPVPVVERRSESVRMSS
ncbi:hypothetical protein GCM10027448_15650 [Nocardioides dilutus]